MSWQRLAGQRQVPGACAQMGSPLSLAGWGPGGGWAEGHSSELGTDRREEGGWFEVSSRRQTEAGDFRKPCPGEQRPMPRGARCAGKGLGGAARALTGVGSRAPWTATSALGTEGPAGTSQAHPAAMAPAVALADRSPSPATCSSSPSLRPAASKQGTRASRPALPHPPSVNPSRCSCVCPALQSSGHGPSIQHSHSW